MNLRATLSELLNDRQKLTRTIIWGVVGFFLLRSCFGGSQNALPSEVTNKLQKQYIKCIRPDDTPIWPGEARQPECGTIDIEVLGAGTVPEAQRTEGITEAICYRAEYDNPFWSTTGTTRHEVKWTTRVAYQVTILQNGTWQIFPQEEQMDLERWKIFACPDYDGID